MTGCSKIGMQGNAWTRPRTRKRWMKMEAAGMRDERKKEAAGMTDEWMKEDGWMKTSDRIPT